MSVNLLYPKVKSLADTISSIPRLWNMKKFFETSSEGRISHYDLRKFLKKMYDYNLKTYNFIYKENFETPETQNPKMSEMQAFKTLMCLHYNIEEDFADDEELIKKDLEILDMLILEIQYHIISESKEFKEAVWG